MRQTRHKKACGAGFGGPHRSNAAERDTDDALAELQIYSVQVRRSKDQRDEVSSVFSSAVSVSQASTKRPHQERHWYRYLARPHCTPPYAQPPSNRQHNITSKWAEILLSVWWESLVVARVPHSTVLRMRLQKLVCLSISPAHSSLSLLPYALADAAFQETFREDSSTPRPRFGLRSGMR